MNEYIALIQKYFPQDQWANAYRVMMTESGGDPNAANDQVPKRERSYGLFQINTNVHPLTREEAMDPEANVRYAAALYQARGWQPWSASQVPGVIDNGTPAGVGQGMGVGVLPTGGTKATQGSPDLGGGNVVYPRHATYEGGVSTSGGQQTQPPILTLLISKKGQPIGSAQVVKRDNLGDPIPGTEGFRYTWKDGTYLEVSGNPMWGWTEEGTATKELSPGGGPVDVIEHADGSRWVSDVSNPADIKPLYQVSPPSTSASARYQASNASPDEPWVQITDPTTGQIRWEPNKNYNPTGSPRAPELVENTQLQNEQLRRQMQPLGAQQMKDLADQQQLIYGMLRRGEIDYETANRLMDTARRNIQATMSGTTVFEQEQANETQRQRRLQAAGELIGQKLAQSSGLASNFLNSAISGASKAMMPAGKTSLGLDPLMLARNYSNEQGGNQLSALAQQLINGMQGGGGGIQSEDEYARLMAQIAAMGGTSTNDTNQPPAPTATGGFVTRPGGGGV